MFERLIGHGWGSLEIAPDRPGYRLGDDVTGTTTVTAKRELGPGTLQLALVCAELHSRTVPRRGRRITHERKRTELWRYEVELDRGIDLPAGVTSAYDFAIGLPPGDTRPDPGELPDWAAGTVAVIDALTFRQRQLVWELQARFRHDGGFDLRRTARIGVALA